MKFLALIPAMVFGNFFHTLAQHTEVDLGKGFYLSNYSGVETILFIPSQTKPVASFSPSPGGSSDTLIKTAIPKVNWVAIPNVIGFGFNKDYVLAVSKKKTQNFYWIINKNKEALSHGLTKDEKRMILSNVRTIHFKKFLRLKKKLSIRIEALAFYSKKHEQK